MKRAIITLVILAVVAAGGWYAYGNYNAQQQAAADQAAAEAAATEGLADLIWASGKLQPVTWAGLNPAIGGIVSAIHVQEGDMVQAGDLLLEIANEGLQAQVQVAEAAVVEAEAARDELMAGATDAQVASAEAAVAAADAAVSLAAGQMGEAQAAVETAQAQVSIAQRQYEEVASHPTASEISAANGRVAMAQAAVETAQAAYNLVRGEAEIGSMPQSQALRQATAALEAAQADAATSLNGPTAEQLAVLSAQITAAQAGVDAAESRMPGAEAAVMSALANQASAQAALDALLAGATTEQIAMADAHVLSASAALASAQAHLRETQVVAPFAGQVGQVATRIGEISAAGTPVIMLGDVSTLHVETTDLRETDVVRLHDGMAVEVSFDALPDEFFQGTVARIAPMSNVDQGSTNYKVLVDVADLDPSLRWGMTAFVNINPDAVTAGSPAGATAGAAEGGN